MTFHFGVPNLIRFLVGIFLLQGVTGLLVYTALTTNWQTTWPLFLILGVSVGALVALWFSSLVGADRRHAVSRAAERFSKEREQIRAKAEQQRVKQVRDTVKAARGRMGAGMSLKSGVVVGGAVGLGVAMMLTQFMALGLITLAAAGGATLGYGVRVRQEKLIAGRRLAEPERAITVIEAQEVRPALANSRRKPRPAGNDRAGSPPL
jgi:hypothetical protein